MNPRFDLIISYWIFAWFILYLYNIIPYSPHLTLVLALLFECVVLVLMILKNGSIYYIALFIIITILIKVIPLYILRDETIDYLPQLLYMGVLVTMYTIWLLLNKQDAIGYFTYQMQGLYKGKATTPAISIIYPYLMKFLGK
jgi:hypothetical protein